MDEKHCNGKMRYDTSYIDVMIRQNSLLYSEHNKSNWYDTIRHMDDHIT